MTVPSTVSRTAQMAIQAALSPVERIAEEAEQRDGDWTVAEAPETAQFRYDSY